MRRIPLKQKEAYGLHPAPSDLARSDFTASVTKNTTSGKSEDVATTDRCTLLLTEQKFLVSLWPDKII